MFPWKTTPPRGLSIRAATRQDVEAIADLWYELMTFHAGLDDRFAVPPNGRAHYITHIANTFRDGNYQVLVAVEDGQVIGYISGYVAENPPIFPHPRYGFIADLCVAAAHRRKGAGKALVLALCRWFRARGLASIQLNVAHHNPTSRAFWGAMGCTEYIHHVWMPLGRQP